MPFKRTDVGNRWPRYSTVNDKAEVDVWQDMDETFGMSSSDAEAGTTYSLALTREGEAFRQRLVDYTPPEEA